jgi:putative oxidoreductase
MRYTLFDGQKDELILVARILLMALFVIYGWGKVTNFSATSGYMASDGLPLPDVAAALAIVMELIFGLAIVVGFYTRPIAAILVIYTFVTALIGHHFWSLDGAARAGAAINFYKNVSIMGGLLLLCVTGPGKYSLDRE